MLLHRWEVRYFSLRKLKHKLLQLLVMLAQKAYDISRTRYKEGTGTQLEIKNADVELRTAKTNKLQAINEYIIAKSELDNLLGRLDSKYLAHVQQQIENWK